MPLRSRPRCVLVSLASLGSLLTGRAVAEIPHSTEYSYEHSNSLEEAAQKFKNSSRDETTFLVDQAVINSSKRQMDATDTGSLAYALGVDQDGHSLERLRLGQSWARMQGVHTYHLDLAANFENYHGALSFLDLEHQNILAEQGGNAPRNLSDSQEFDGSITFGDAIRLAQYTDLAVDASHAEGQTQTGSSSDVGGVRKDLRRLDLGTLRFEQRFGLASIWARVTDSEIVLQNESDAIIGPAKIKQSTLDREARYNVLLYPRLTGNIGYRDIYTKASQALHTYRSGPEAGLKYDGQIWLWQVEAFRAAAAGKNTELFGLASLTWLVDPNDTFNASITRDVNLQAAFDIAQTNVDQRLVARQDSATVAQVNWNKNVGRSRFKLEAQRSLLDGGTSHTYFTQGSLDSGYSLTQRDEVSLLLVGRSTDYQLTLQDPTTRRKFESANLGFRHYLPGTLTAVGGHMFWMVASGVEHFTESALDNAGDRVTFTFTLGQTGNF